MHPVEPGQAFPKNTDRSAQVGMTTKGIYYQRCCFVNLQRNKRCPMVSCTRKPK